MTASTPALRSAQENRGTIFVEDARVVGVKAFPGDQFILRMAAPETARRALPGSFVHIRCDESIPMRRPLSIMRTDADEGWIEVLFKVVGEGLRALGTKSVGDQINIIGPIGKGFSTSRARSRPLLIGGGVGIPPMVCLTEHLLKDDHDWRPLVIMGSEIPFPFQLTCSDIPTPWLAAETVSTMPLMEQWQVPCRLASLSEFEGTYRGYVTDLKNFGLIEAVKDVRVADDRGNTRARGTRRGRSVQLWTDANAAGSRKAGTRVRPAVPGFAGGIHGLRSRWLRRLHRAGSDRRRAGHETGLCRRPRLRCGIRLYGVAHAREVRTLSADIRSYPDRETGSPVCASRRQRPDGQRGTGIFARAAGHRRQHLH